MKDYIVSLRNGDSFNGTMDSPEAERLKADVQARKEEMVAYQDTEGELVVIPGDIMALALNKRKPREPVGLSCKHVQEPIDGGYPSGSGKEGTE